MSALFYLIPISLILALLALAGFCWTVHAQQYDDLEGDSARILDDEDLPVSYHGRK